MKGMSVYNRIQYYISYSIIGKFSSTRASVKFCTHTGMFLSFIAYFIFGFCFLTTSIIFFSIDFFINCFKDEAIEFYCFGQAVFLSLLSVFCSFSSSSFVNLSLEVIYILLLRSFYFFIFFFLLILIFNYCFFFICVMYIYYYYKIYILFLFLIDIF